MTNLATRIADVEKTVHELECCGRSTCAKAAKSLRRMAARIEELEKALEPFADAYKGREGWDGDWTIGGSPLRNCHLRTAARAVNGG
jgi:hypothetical protein